MYEDLDQSNLKNAKLFSDRSELGSSRNLEDFCSFLCGNARLFSVSAIIHKNLNITPVSKKTLIIIKKNERIILVKNLA